MSNDGATSAIASSVGIIVVSTLMIIAMQNPSDHAKHTYPVRLPPPVLPSSLPHRCLHLAKARQLSLSIRVVPRYEDSLRWTELYNPSGHTKSDLDLEAQSWKPAREKKIANAERSHSPSLSTPSVELPNSPPPSYSQIDKSLLVAALYS
ncbi:hypothetical protein BJV74DRAFT_794037 [Russula compacta]|nr:hypothetical protein BJV74DRAFT_794037 [Russula compacta]